MISNKKDIKENRPQNVIFLARTNLLCECSRTRQQHYKINLVCMCPQQTVSFRGIFYFLNKMIIRK